MAGGQTAGAKKASLDRERDQIHQAMLSSVSHDLKTPLASIIGSLEIYGRMHDRLSSDKKEALIKTALVEAYRLDNFITNILDMAKLENDMVKLRHEPIDMRILLRDCITRLGNREGSDQVALPQHYPELTAISDSTLLSRAVFVVLDNALKHGNVPVTISIDPSPDRKQLLIYIRDHGAGIPLGREEEIFSKYTRFSRKDQQNAGTGLGLPICREIMRLLGGGISVINHPQGGAVFTLNLPVH